MKAPRIPERVVQQQVLHLLRSVGGCPYVLGTTRPKGDRPGTFMSRGWPDVGCFLPFSATGTTWHWLWVEVKAKGGRLRPEQAVFARQCAEAGVPHVVGGVDEVLAYLRAHGYVRETAHYRERKTA